MKLLPRLLALFLVLPVVELFLLVQVDRLIGFWPTVGLILFTGLVGGLLARREGLSVWRRLSARLQTGALPGNELIDGVIILVAGALLVTPGVLTDVIGFLGLLPPSRSVIRKGLRRRFERSVQQGQVRVFGGGFSPQPPQSPDASWQGTAADAPRHADGISQEQSE